MSGAGNDEDSGREPHRSPATSPSTSGTLDLAGFTANRSTAGGVLTVAAGASLRIGGTATLPSNYSTNTLNPTSTVEYYGANQAVANTTYGNLLLSGTGTKTVAGRGRRRR